MDEEENLLQRTDRKRIRSKEKGKTARVLSDNGDTTEDEVDEPSEENHRNDATAATCFFGSRRQISIAGSFGNLAKETTDTKSRHSLIVGMSSLMFWNKWVLRRNTPKSVPNV